MSTSILNIGITGLNAAQTGIATSGHNISNASTPGYTRQQIVQQANAAMYTGAGFIGQGTNVATVTRAYAQYLSAQVLTSQASASEMDSYQAQINQISNLLGDPTAGLTPALASFFSGVQDVAANPTSMPSRQSLLSGAQTLVARFQSLDQRMSEIRAGNNEQIAGEVSLINSYGKQIGALNQSITLAQAAGTNQSANDLLDQRDQLIASLNKEIRVSTVMQGDGTCSIFIGTGQPLVVGTEVSSLQAVNDASDPLKTMIGLRLPNGAAVTLSDNLFTGGTLGGLLSFRNQSLNAAQNSLGRIAIALAQTFNDQHQLGQDLNGALGGKFFNVPTPLVFPNSNNPVPAVGVSVTISDVSALTSSDYQLTSNGGGRYTLLRLSDNKVLLSSATLPASIDGLSISLAGTPPSGASYLIEPTRVGARDIGVAINDLGSIAAAAPIRTSAALNNTGTASIDAGAVSSTGSLPLSPITLTYAKATNTLSGFPVGASVSIPGDPSSPYVIASTLDPVKYTSGATISFNGISFAISGTPADNDSFNVGPNSNGVGDNRNALLLGQLQTSKILDGSATSAPITTFQAAYAALVSQVGNTARQVQVNGKAQQALVDQATSAQQSVSGVNLDEEAASLMRYQQAYQASAKLITVAGKLFDTLLAI